MEFYVQSETVSQALRARPVGLFHWSARKVIEKVQKENDVVNHVNAMFTASFSSPRRNAVLHRN